MEKSALVAVADGSEDVETVGVIDVLTRAGLKVTIASVSGNREVKLGRVGADARGKAGPCSTWRPPCARRCSCVLRDMI